MGIKKNCVAVLKVLRSGYRHLKETLCTYAVFGKDDRSSLIRLAVSLAKSWKVTKESCFDAGYTLLEAAENIRCSKFTATLRCTSPVFGITTTYEVKMNRTFKDEKYRLFTYELPVDVTSSEDVELELDVNGRKTTVGMRRKEPVGDSLPVKMVTKNYTAHNLLTGNSALRNVNYKTKSAVMAGDNGHYVAEGDLEVESINSWDSGIVMQDEEVTLTLGIRLNGGLMHEIIKVDTAVPTKKKVTVTTASDFQTAMDCFIFEGERPLAADNRLLSEMTLNGIPSARQGQENVDVTLEIDQFGDLTITAESVTSGKMEEKIIPYFKLRADRKAAAIMIKEAAKYSTTDQKIRDRIQSWQDLQQRAYSLKWAMKDRRGKKGMAFKDMDAVAEECEAVIDWTWQNKDLQKFAYERRMAKLNQLYNSY